MIDETTARLRAALDQAQHLAEKAWPSPWEVGETSDFFGGSACVMMPLPFPDGVKARTGLTSYVPLGRQDEATIRHIAAWDPARVLKLIERDRALLDAYLTAKAAQEKAADERSLGYLRPPAGGSVKDGWQFAGRVNTLRAEVDRAAAFWLGEDTE